MPAKPLNILLITSDQQHYNTLGILNDKIKTPALDRLCREGTRFDRAYCPNPTCTPTRASIITGMYPSQHGAWSLGTKLPETVPTVGEAFSKAGYKTALIGKAHFQPLATEEGNESIECQPILRDLDFWRKFHGPWYGFDHVELSRNHTCESHVGQHYAIWMEENGLADWADYFDPYPPDPAAMKKRRESRTWDIPQEFHYTKWTGDRTIAQIEQSAQKDQPFFIWSSFHDPHPPYEVPQPWASMYDPNDMAPGQLTPGEHDKNPAHFALTQEDAPDFKGKYFEDQNIHGAKSHLRDMDELRKDMACYYGMISFMDQQIGRILDALDEKGLTENTLVVFSTDHGHFIGEHGLIAKAIHHYEDLLRVPFIVRWPGKTPAGKASDAIQNLVDLAPSFLAAAGLDVPVVMTGLDQTDCWAGGDDCRSWSITENHHTRTSFHMKTYVNARYKITVYRKGSDGELFDLQEDPGEINNLWHDPAAAKLKADLMEEFMTATLECEPMPMERISSA